MTYGFIGTGNMASALATAACRAVDPRKIYLSNRTADKARKLAEKLGANLSDNAAIAGDCDYIFLGVKPQMMADLLTTLRPVLKQRKTPFVLVSMAAGLTIDALAEVAGVPCPIIRIMPNTPCAVGEGLTLYACSPEVSQVQEQTLLHLLSRSGALEPLSESLIDAGSAVAGCGGAFACLFLEALADGAVACGVPRAKAMEYAAATLIGAGQMVLTTKQHPGALKDAVCSPGGSTIAGVRILEERGFRGAVMDCVCAAYDKNKKLGNETICRPVQK